MTSRSAPRSAVLPRQAVKRVLAATLAVVAIIVLLTFWFQHSALDKSARAAMVSLETSYSDKILILEQEWHEHAIHLHNRLELKNLFSDPALGWQPLRDALKRESNGPFSLIIVTDPQSRILFRTEEMDVRLPDTFAHGHDKGWFEEEDRNRLFRWFTQPLWLGEAGAGWMVMFVPVDNAVLFRSAMPGTDLFLLRENHLLASSLGSETPPVTQWRNGVFWEGRFRVDQLSLPWGLDKEGAPQLFIRHKSVPLFTTGEILTAGLTTFGLLSLLLWRTLGVWIVHLARRISILDSISREFTARYHLTPELQAALVEVKGDDHNEVAAVADAMEHLTRTVVLHAEAMDKQALRLKESEERFRAIADSLGDAIVVYDEEGGIHYCNRIGATLFSLEPEQLLTRSLPSLFAERWLAPSWKKKLLLPMGGTQTPEENRLEGVALSGDGKEFPVAVSLSRWHSRDKLFHTAIIQDISAHKMLEARDMRAYVNRVAISALLEIGLEPLPLRRKLEVALEIILTVPWLAVQYKGSIFISREDGTLEMVAQKGLHSHLLHACHVIPPGFCLCGRAALSRKLVFSNQLDHRHDITFDGIAEHGHYCVPIQLREELLGVLNLYVDHGHLHDLEEEAFLSTISNTLAGLIERGMVEDRVHHLATHDILTGLPNRMLFKELLEQELRRMVRLDQILAVGFLDLDHFKEVNDTLGHEAGDLLLKAVGERVKQCLRDSDILSRLGGDEFTIILPGLGLAGHAAGVAAKIVQVLGQPFPLLGQECHIGVSIGIALFPEHGQTVETLLQGADQAMYAVKKRGRNGFAIFSPSWKEGGEKAPSERA